MPDDDRSKGVTRRRVLTAGAGLAAAGGVGAAVYSAWRNSTYLFLLHEAPTHAGHIDHAWHDSQTRRINHFFRVRLLAGLVDSSNTAILNADRSELTAL